MKEKYLPTLENKKSVSIFEQRSIGGLCRQDGATGDQVYDMKNMAYAFGGGIKTRPLHRRYVSVESDEEFGHGICVHNGDLYVARGTALYRVVGCDSLARVCSLSNTDKIFVTFGDRLFILPDRVYVDADNVVRPLDVSVTGVEVQADESGSLVSSTVDWATQGICEGDGITLSCASAPKNDGAYRVASVQGQTLVLDRPLAVTGTVTVSVNRCLPPVSYLCVTGNRLMGCAGHTVYISEAGNPFNWCAVADLGSSAPVDIQTGGQGEFTGCTCWQGYGLFLKEDRIYKLMGSGAYGYYLSETAAPGVAAGEAKTLSVQGGALYYKGVSGVYRYEGSYPVSIGDALGENIQYACAAGDHAYYYMAGLGEAGMPCLYTFDTQREAWYAADDSLYIRFMVNRGGKIYALNNFGEVWQLGNDWEPTHTGTSEEEVRGPLWASVTFGYESCRLPERHTLSEGRCPTESQRLQKVTLLADALMGMSGIPTMTVWIAYDDEEEWREIGHFEGPFSHRLLDCPLIPRTCDHYRLMWETTGDWTVHRVYRTYEH